MKDYALCYQFPSSPTGFQNFAMWPLFTCLTMPNIVGLIEAAVSPTRRIILTSHFPAMLTVAAETIRFCVRVFEWSGLYVPVVHARHVTAMVQEPGPYILGITTECRSLFTAPEDSLLVDLDRNLVITTNPPNILSSGQRTKMINRLTQSLHSDVDISGVPQHLRSAYGGGKLIPAGHIIVLRGEVESIQDPVWWNQDAIMAVMDHVCEKLGRNTGFKAVFGGATKKPLMTKISMRHMNEIVRERNQYSRDALEAWQDFINLKGRMDGELAKVTKRNNWLEQETETWKSQFEQFKAFADQLNKEVSELRVKIESHKRENKRLTGLIDQQKDDAARLSIRLSGTERQRDNALEALVLQQGIAEDLERERSRNRRDLSALSHTAQTLTRQRDEAHGVVLHLRSLINGQTHHMEHIVRSIGSAPELAEYINQGYVDDDVSEDETANEDSPVEATSKRVSTTESIDGQAVTPSMESQLLSSGARNSKRYSTMSITDVADKHLREKTDAIADIIRSISEQCAAAVEGLQLANGEVDDLDDRVAATADHHNVDLDDDNEEYDDARDDHTRTDSAATGNLSMTDNIPTTNNNQHLTATGRTGTGHLTPTTSEHSSIPPTPDLVHQRSSTALSMVSSVQTAPDVRTSLQQNPKVVGEDVADRESVHNGSVSGDASVPMTAAGASGAAGKKVKPVVFGEEEGGSRPVTARVVEA